LRSYAFFTLGVQKSVPLGVAERVRDAFIAMAEDPEGHHILHSINQHMGLGLTGWDAANDAEYQFAVDSYQLLFSQNKSNE
jgi:ABC-type phosphate/phosphonate transport system substrate-binding protein